MSHAQWFRARLWWRLWAAYPNKSACVNTHAAMGGESQHAALCADAAAWRCLHARPRPASQFTISPGFALRPQTPVIPCCTRRRRRAGTCVHLSCPAAQRGGSRAVKLHRALAHCYGRRPSTGGGPLRRADGRGPFCSELVAANSGSGPALPGMHAGQSHTPATVVAPGAAARARRASLRAPLAACCPPRAESALLAPR